MAGTQGTGSCLAVKYNSKQRITKLLNYKMNINSNMKLVDFIILNKEIKNTGV